MKIKKALCGVLVLLCVLVCSMAIFSFQKIEKENITNITYAETNYTLPRSWLSSLTGVLKGNIEQLAFEYSNINLANHPTQIEICEGIYANYTTLENGRYDIYIGASSQDIRLETSVIFDDEKAPYSINLVGETMIG